MRKQNIAVLTGHYRDIRVHTFFSLWCNSPTRAQAASFFRFLDHTQLNTCGMTSFKKWSARRRCRYLHNTQQTQETNIHVLSGLKTHDPSNRAVANLRLRPHSHRDWLQILHFLTDFDVQERLDYTGCPRTIDWYVEKRVSVFENELIGERLLYGCCIMCDPAYKPDSQSQQCSPKHLHCCPCSYSILFKLLSNPDIVPISFSPHFVALYRGWR